MVLYDKPLQEYPVNAGVLQAFILTATFILRSYSFLLNINDLPDDVIFNIAIYDDTTLYCKSDQA